MTKKYRLVAESSMHEGGTKYYQVFRITRLGAFRSPGCVVTHWGAVHPGAPSTPRLHGQSKVSVVFNGEANSTYRSAISGKRKRGYGDWRSSPLDKDLGEDDFEAMMKDIFPSDIAETIIGNLRVDPEEFEADEDIPKTEVEIEAAAAPAVEAPKSENWGTW